MSVLRQSTAVDILLGPFVDQTDGFTAEAGLTVNQASVLLSKNGQALTQKSDVTACANDNSTAWYNCELDTTDSNTVGTLVVTAHVAGARPVIQEYQVIEEAIYDALYVASADGFNASGQVALLTATQASIDAIETDTGTTLDANITAILADTNELQGDWTNAGRLDTIIDSILTDTGTTLDAHLTDIKGTAFVKDTHSLIDIETYVDLIDDGTSGLAKIATDVAAILVDTGTTLDGKLDTIDDFLDTELAAITAEVVTAAGEPAQGAPPVSANIADKISYLYKAFRNKATQTSTEYDLYDDGATVVDHKSTVSDDGTTFTRGEIATGP